MRTEKSCVGRVRRRLTRREAVRLQGGGARTPTAIALANTRNFVQIKTVFQRAGPVPKARNAAGTATDSSHAS